MPYNVFIRTWWKNNPKYPNGLEPEAGEKEYIAEDLDTEQEARAMCREYNSTHDAGRYSLKAEFEDS